MSTLPPPPPPFSGEIRPDLVQIVSRFEDSAGRAWVAYRLPDLPDGFTFFTDGRVLDLRAHRTDGNEIACLSRADEWAPVASLSDQTAHDGVLDLTAFPLGLEGDPDRAAIARHALSLLRGRPAVCTGFPLDAANSALSAILADWFDTVGLRGIDFVTLKRISKAGADQERLMTLQAASPMFCGVPASAQRSISAVLLMLTYIGTVIGYDPGIDATPRNGAFFPALSAHVASIHLPASAHAAMRAQDRAAALRTAYPEIDRYINKAKARLSQNGANPTDKALRTSATPLPA